jgi:hypothetical protein
MKAWRWILAVTACAGLVAIATWAAWAVWGSVRGRAPDAVQLAAAERPLDSADAASEFLEHPTLSDSPVGEARAAVQSEGIVGRVLEEGSERPLPRFWAHLSCGSRVLGESITDDRGGFFLPLPPTAKCGVGVDHQYGWIVLEPERALGEPQPGTLVHLLFHARASKSGPVRGVLVDRETKEAVPFYDLLVSQSGSSRESQTTDESGRFETQSAFEEGEVRLLFLDNSVVFSEGNQLVIQHVPESDEPRYEISVGPTYQLQVTAPPDVRLQDGVLSLDLWSNPERYDSGTWTRSALRNGDPPWVRFVPSSAYLVSPPRTWRLTLQAHEGAWVGSAPVESTRGIDPSLVHIVLEPRGRLEGRVFVEGQEEEALRSSVRLTLDALEEYAVPQAHKWFAATGSGAYGFPGLRPGRWMLSATSDAYKPASMEVLVVGGRPTVRDVALQAERSAGAIQGRVILSAAEPAKDVRVVLSSVRPAGRQFLGSLRYATGVEEASFLFEDVPQGDYVCSIYSRGGSVARILWSPEAIEVTPPNDRLEFRQESFRESATPYLRVVDAESGEELDDCTLQGVTEECRASNQEFGSGDPSWFLSIVPASDSLRWIIGAPGHQPVYWKDSDLRARGSSELEIRLERGWGMEFCLLGPGFLSLRDAAVLLDGEEAGRTDADGLLRIAREKAPEKVELRYQDWKPQFDEHLLSNGKLATRQARLLMFLAPPE